VNVEGITIKTSIVSLMNGSESEMWRLKEIIGGAYVVVHLSKSTPHGMYEKGY